MRNFADSWAIERNIRRRHHGACEPDSGACPLFHEGPLDTDSACRRTTQLMSVTGEFVSGGNLLECRDGRYLVSGISAGFKVAGGHCW